MNVLRILRHVFAEGSARRRFPAAALDTIREAIGAGERRHRGQVCFAIEGALPLRHLWRGCTPRERAEEIFARLRVWDTEANSGVLIYVLLADRAIEIVADRGIAARVDAAQWNALCERMRRRLADGRFREAVIEGVDTVSEILAQHFPTADGVPADNELSDHPHII